MNPVPILKILIPALLLIGGSATKHLSPTSLNKNPPGKYTAQPDTLPIPDDTLPHLIIPKTAINVPEERWPKSNKIRILTESDFNAQDGVGPKDGRLNWKGLFYSKAKPDSFYIKPTRLKFTLEHSEMDEADSAKTGWRLSCNNTDYSLLFIAGTKGLRTGPVKKALNYPKLYYAGQKIAFKYYGVKYTLYSTGRKTNGRIYNYKLFLQAKVNGHVYNQLLVSQPPDIMLGVGGDYSETVDIQFAGDLDGDHIPDFIIEKSGFSYADTYLYLSKPAGDRAIVKLVSAFGVSD